MELSRRGLFGVVAAAIAGPRAGKLAAATETVTFIEPLLPAGPGVPYFWPKLGDLLPMSPCRPRARRGESVRFCAPDPASAAVAARADVQV